MVRLEVVKELQEWNMTFFLKHSLADELDWELNLHQSSYIVTTVLTRNVPNSPPHPQTISFRASILITLISGSLGFDPVVVHNRELEMRVNVVKLFLFFKPL